jgi:hypothetical protein
MSEATSIILFALAILAAWSIVLVFLLVFCLAGGHADEKLEHMAEDAREYGRVLGGGV